MSFKVRKLFESIESEIGSCHGPLWYKMFECKGCEFWIGRCVKGKMGKTASTTACEFFNRKKEVKCFE